MLISRTKLCEWLSLYWIPGGLTLFLIGIFWAPTQHLFAVWMPYLILLPALVLVFLNPEKLHFMRRDPVLGLTISYLIYMASITILLNGQGGVEYIKWGFYITLFVVAIGAFNALTARGLAMIALVGAIAAAAAGLYATFRDMHSGAFWAASYRLRGYGNLYNELRSGFMFGACALFALWYSSKEATSILGRYFSIFIAIICLVSTLLTGSRAPLLALAITIGWITATQKRWLHFAAVSVLSLSILRLFWDRLSDRGTSLRPEIWHYVWEQYLLHPWIGIGLSQRPVGVPTSMGIKYNTHNVFLAVLYQGGCFGFLLFFALIAITLRQSWRIRNSSSIGLLAALLQMYSIICLQFEGIALSTRPSDDWLMLWLPAALCLYAARETKYLNS